MFRRSKQLALKCETLKNEVYRLEETVRRQMLQISAFENSAKPKEDPRATSMAFNFGNIDVFCIERNTNKESGLGQTVIGYWAETIENGVKTKKAKEWHLFINEEIHQKLIQQYQEYIRYQRQEDDVRNKVVKK